MRGEGAVILYPGLSYILVNKVFLSLFYHLKAHFKERNGEYILHSVLIIMYWPQAQFLTANSMLLNRMPSQLSGAGARSSSNLRSLSSSAAFYTIITKLTGQLVFLYFTKKKHCTMKKFILTFVDTRLYIFQYLWFMSWFVIQLYT